MSLRFGPAESKFIVFDKLKTGEPYQALPLEPDSTRLIGEVWNVQANHVDGSTQTFEIDNLVDFNTLPFVWMIPMLFALSIPERLGVLSRSISMAKRLVPIGMAKPYLTSSTNLNREKISYK